MQKSIQRVSVRRVSTEDQRAKPEDENCNVAIESPITIDVEGVGAYTVLCTPSDARAMAIGFLFSEGVIDRIEDISLLNECTDSPDVIRVKLTEAASKSKTKKRSLLIVSSCGMCGSETLENKLSSLPKVGETLKVAGAMLGEANETLRKAQALFEKSGGTHAIGILKASGEMISFAEDVGRHNALDKAIGKCIVSRISPAGCWSVMSGRASLEMVAKCARAGIELISAISAPTSLALEAAKRCNITVCAFVRGGRATVFTCPERVVV